MLICFNCITFHEKRETLKLLFYGTLSDFIFARMVPENIYKKICMAEIHKRTCTKKKHKDAFKHFVTIF